MNGRVVSVSGRMSEGIERQRGRWRRRGKEILKGSSHTMGALSLSLSLFRTTSCTLHARTHLETVLADIRYWCAPM